jgi:teichuronic acid biosynthesis glycosyltransferase TuaH
MLQGENIICIANTSWFGKYAKSTVQLLERLAAHNNVLFVEYPYTMKDVYATIRGLQDAPVKRMLRLDHPLKKIRTNVGTEVLSLVIPPAIPVFFLKNERLFRFFFSLNVFIYKRTVQKAITKAGFHNPIVITAYNPIYGNSLIGEFDEKAHIYYCYDGVESAFFGKRIYTIEEEFARRVDGIITTSDFLNEAKSRFNPNCFVVKNGVDFPVFVKHAKKQPHCNVRKKVGFIGSLDPRFDIDTVEYAISKLPEYDFEFTGDMRNQAMKSRLQRYKHVTFYDPVSPNDVPKLLATSDVGMIPYLVNEVNRNIYPLKINEYLSVGVPLVMTPFAVLPEFDGLVSVSSDKEDFVRKLRDEVENDSKEKIELRIDFASTNSWEARTDLFGDKIKKIVSDKENSNQK